MIATSTARGLAATALVLVAPLLAAEARAQDYAAIVAASDRSESDKQTDQRRKPAELLKLAGVKTGMRVLDMGAGGGYSTELLARTVGPKGKVYAQGTDAANERAQKAFEERAKKPVMANVVRVTQKFDDPVPAGVANLNVVTFLFYYHDTTYMPVDRAKMNRRIFAALKPGGVYVVADHSARPGEGTGVGKTMHRIEETALRKEVEAAGFRLVASGDFLRNPADPRDNPVFRPEQPVDEFILKFEHPRPERHRRRQHVAHRRH